MDDSLPELLNQLTEDKWRQDNDFSPEMTELHKLLFHPFATNADCELAIGRWLQKKQPCIFGRIAAGSDKVHCCIIRDGDLQKGDHHVASCIHEQLLAWKRRSLRPAPQIAVPGHGFLLVVCSPRVCLAEPNDALYRLAIRLLDLWECARTTEKHGDVYWEHLYLAEPGSGFRKFSIMIDFFASQGDRRWWHDHRFPGGIAFTANSAGHMARCRQWYDGKERRLEWLTSTAMRTISLAANTPYGKATWLRDIPSDGRPFIPNVPCPFSEPDRIPRDLRGKDWTRYGGDFHTDQSVRREFFRPEADKPVPAGASDWLLDFTYLHDAREEDHIKLIEGQAVSEAEVYSELGDPRDWTAIASKPRQVPKSVRRSTMAAVEKATRDFANMKRALAEVAENWPLPLDQVSVAERSLEVLRDSLRGRIEVDSLLKATERWTLSDDELAGMDS